MNVNKSLPYSVMNTASLYSSTKVENVDFFQVSRSYI
jgi:hypothetical protein